MRTNKHQDNTPNPAVPGYTENVMTHEMIPEEAQSGILTPDGDLAIDGGKLPGNHDDFEGEIEERVHPVAGAHGLEIHEEEAEPLVDAADEPAEGSPNERDLDL